MKLKYSTGAYHSAPDMLFENVLEAWGVVQYLHAMGRLIDVVCCTEDGDIVSPPYDNSQIPGIIEERIADRVGTHPEPRRWILQRLG